MDWINELLHPAIGYIVTGVLAALVGWFGKRLKDSKEKRNKISEELADIRETLRQNTLLTCKALIYTDIPNVSLTEKLKAFQFYRSEGGNGEAYRYMTQLLEHDADEFLNNHQNLL